MFFLARSALTNPRPHKCDVVNVDQSKFYVMWKSKVLAYLSALCKLYMVKETDNPVMVGDINVSEEELSGVILLSRRLVILDRCTIC